MLADTPEPARVAKRSFGRKAESVDLTVLAAAERAISRIFNYDSQAIVEAFYYDTFSSMGVNLKTMGEAGPGRDISDLFGDRAQHDARDAADASAPRPSTSRRCARR